MVRWARRFVGLAVILAVFGVVVTVARTQVAHAQGDNAFPGVTNGTDWTFNNSSPDPNLTWLYNGTSTTINGKTTHVLRTTSNGRNKGTRLRIYYSQRPVSISVNINVVTCALDAPTNFAGNVQIVLGGQTVYNQPTDGKKITNYDRYWTWQYAPRSPTDSFPYVLRVDNSLDTYTSGSRANSPVCQNFSNSYTIDKHKEDCSNLNSTGTRCAGNGTETYSGFGTTTGTIQPNGSPFNAKHAVGNMLDNRTFTVGFPATGTGGPSMGFDSSTGLWFADLDIDLSNNSDPTLPPSSVVQHINFKVNALNATSTITGGSMAAKMGYRYFTDETEASKYFGLEGNGGTSNKYAGYGQKFAIPFGRDCSASGAPVSSPITLYDPDVPGYGPSYAVVFERDPSTKVVRKLTKAEYNFVNNVSWDSGGNRIQLTAGNNQNSVFEVNSFKVGYQYMLAVVNPNDPNKQDPAPNIWSLRLPTDSINGLINCRYDLVPHLNSVQPAFSAYGDTLTPHGWIDNTQNSTTAGNHSWQITRAVFATRPADLARAAPTNTNNGEPVCGFIQRLSGAPLSCSVSYSGTYPTDTDKKLSEVVGPYPPGSYVCYITSVYNPTWLGGDDTQWANSTMQCSVGGVKPKLRVSGYDLKTSSGIDTSLSGQNGNTFGSWGEYGVFSNGTNTNMASGSGLLGGGPSSQLFWSPLTFANTGFYGQYGGVTLPSFNPGTGTAIGNVLGATTYGEGDKRVLQYNGTLYITGNLTYDNDGNDNNGYNSIKDIPEIKIVADNIIVSPSVTQIDPWLVVRSSAGTYGKLSTCGTSPGDPAAGVTGFQPFNASGLLNTGMCQNELKLNGPVTADELYAYRTKDAAGDVWAENFDLRASNFLSSYAGVNTARPVARTELITELPPRF
jgi:hypothetical protein